MIQTTSPTQLAIEYAIDTPTATADEIQVLFGIRQSDATYAHLRGVNSRRTDWPLRPVGKGKRPMNNTAALAAARKWAIESKINSEDAIYERFNITSRQCRGIAKEATQAKLNDDPQVEKRKAAKEYLQANRKVASQQIANKFGVSADYVRRQRYLMLEAERKQALALAKQKNTPKPPRKQRRLYAVMVDGERCDARLVRDTKSIERFEMVLV